MKKSKDKDFIEFVLDDEVASSDEFISPEEETPVVLSGTLEPSTKLEDMPPAFRELAEPKLPTLENHNRARLQMQTPNRLFFYWSIGANPFHRLNKALGTQTANYMLVLKLIDLKHDAEQVFPVEAEGNWWFNVEANGEYRAEIGFYAPNRPYIRALFSNTVTTPRKSPSPRVDTESDWAIPSHRFARVLEVAGFTQDAFDVAIAGDDAESADVATRSAFVDLVEAPGEEFDRIAADELRHALLLIASGLSLEELRWKISPALFAILQARSEMLSAERALGVLKERFEIEADEIVEEEFGTAVVGASEIHFPRRMKTRRSLPKITPLSSADVLR